MRWFACPICTILTCDRALCAHCAEGLYLRRELNQRDLGAYRARALFAWRRDDWPGLRWWALALKHKEHDAFWADVATWMIDAFGPPGAGAELVPVPTSKPLNHARGLAAALARRCGARVSDVLVARSRRVQRRLDAAARRARRFELRDGAWPRGPVIVMDDIITSGATAEAAYRALGQPSSCEVWCVMDRNTPRR